MSEHRLRQVGLDAAEAFSNYAAELVYPANRFHSLPSLILDFIRKHGALPPILSSPAAISIAHGTYHSFQEFFERLADLIQRDPALMQYTNVGNSAKIA